MVALRRPILLVLDPSAGGAYALDAREIVERVRARVPGADAAGVHLCLKGMVRDGRIEAVKREDGPIVYTRPDVLLRAPGVARTVNRRRTEDC